MADGIFNIAKGAIAEKIRDGASNIEVVLLQAAEASAALADYATMASLLAGSNTEATFTNYARKTGITGTVTVDNTNDRVDCSIPNQSWLVAGGATNNSLVKMIICYRESAGDAGLVPLLHLDYATTTDGSDLVPTFNAIGIFRAS